MTEFKKWKIKDCKNYTEFADRYSVCSLAAKVAAARVDVFSEKELFSADDCIYSPFDLKDMDRAAEIINDGVNNQIKIVVYGDYDTDGVTATVILYSYLEAIGADVSYYIPSRESEGYGLSFQAIEKLSQEGCELIITVDNGIAAVKEIEFAKSLGMQVVVTDHHMPQETIPDCVVVNPHRVDCNSKFKDICGAFVAFKLVAALDGGDYAAAFEQYAELVAVATIADVVPLVSENRTIVRLGLERLKNTDNLGLHALIEASFSKDAAIDSTAVTYSIVPRINAAGRMGDASRAVELLVCDDPKTVSELCQQICQDNTGRKQIEADILSEIEQMFLDDPSLCTGRIVVVCGKLWHHGVLGIVASKLVEMTGKPSIVLSDDGEYAVGSGRSVEGFSLFDALCSCINLFERFGGHSLAVGVTLKADKVGLLRNMINDYARENFKYMPLDCIEVEAQISPKEISLAAVKELSHFEPFGKCNSFPLFMLSNLTLTKLFSIGNGKHTRLSLFGDGFSFTALYFGVTADELKYYQGKKIDIVVRLKINVYSGEESVTVQVVSIRPSGISDSVFFKEKQLFEAARAREELNQKQAQYLMPAYDEAAEVYRFIKQLGSFDGGADLLWWLMGEKINRARVSVILEAFCESELCSVQSGCITAINSAQKKDLFGCDILKYISGFFQS